MEEDRRRWTRYSPELDTTHIRFPGGVAKGAVVDYSFGGASFTVGTVGIEQGRQIEVLWNGAWMKGTVINQTISNGYCRIGVRWKPARETEAVGSNPG